jgi:hypothetical protein
MLLLIVLSAIPALLILVLIIFHRRREGSGSRFQFYAKGKKAGFSAGDINKLYNLAVKSNLERPDSLFQSSEKFDVCIKSLVRAMGFSGDEDFESQNFLSRLYEYRKKIALEKMPAFSKRRSIRAKIDEPAFLYDSKEALSSRGLEMEVGVKCRIKDISDTGCAISVKTQFDLGARLKVQFVLDASPLVMIVTVRSVKYEEESGRFILHTEADKLPLEARNYILSEVFGVYSD